MTADYAFNPEIASGATKGRTRPLTHAEQFQRSKAICKAVGLGKEDSKLHGVPGCSGNLFVGLFFDGTGNNEQNDFKDYRNDLRHQKHSNVARLYHAYPDAKEVGTNKYFAYYIPGVGTPFPEIGDDGGTLGSAAAWGGEPRIIWGLTRIFNAVHRYHYGPDLIPNAQAKAMAEALGGLGSVGAQRRLVFKETWQARLKEKIAQRKPQIDQINLSVFGFSRGAAEARAFVNWLYELCEYQHGRYWFAGIPLHVQFLGLFDTVASVGLAGLYSLLEGRQSWADDNMQIHPGVEQCLHFVAAHEVRACFPLDSVRINGTYPPNAKEYLFPGAHSDVGGGYLPQALGKDDWGQDGQGQPVDLQLARIPGYEMYRAAIAAGVPFYSEQQLVAAKQADVWDALIPAQSTLNAVAAYYQHAQITPGPLEDMVRQHMSWYFTYRLAVADKGMTHAASSANHWPEYRRALKRPNASFPVEGYQNDAPYLASTQYGFLNVLAAVCQQIQERISANDAGKEADGQYLVNPLQPTHIKGSPWALVGNTMLAGPALGAALGSYLARILGDLPQLETKIAVDDLNRAKSARLWLERWERFLRDNGYPEVIDESAPERDMLQLLRLLRPEAELAAPIQTLFGAHVHDSMAGFIGMPFDEFRFNGFGLAKLRRIYFGDAGDKFVRDQAHAQNKQRRQSPRVAAKREERAVLYRQQHEGLNSTHY